MPCRIRITIKRRVLRSERVHDDDEHLIERRDRGELRSLSEGADVGDVGHGRDGTRRGV